MGPLLPEVVVNGETIPAARIAAEAQMHLAPQGKPGLTWGAAARALAVPDPPAPRGRPRWSPRRAPPAGRGPARDQGGGADPRPDRGSGRPAPPEEAAIRAAYDRDREAFRTPTLNAAAHILLAAPPGDAEATARALLAELAADPGAFERLARAHSACSSREAGGRLSQIAAGEIAAEPVATRYGLHLIRLDARAEGAVLPYEHVAPRIRAAFERAAWARAARALVAELAAAAEIRGVALQAA